MRALELKIPPPVIALLCAALMWAMARYWPSPAWAGSWRLPLTLLLVGLTIIFLIAVGTIPAFAAYAGGSIPVTILAALLITLIGASVPLGAAAR